MLPYFTLILILVATTANGATSKFYECVPGMESAGGKDFLFKKIYFTFQSLDALFVVFVLPTSVEKNVYNN